jgi:hypothetical protein
MQLKVFLATVIAAAALPAQGAIVADRSIDVFAVAPNFTASNVATEQNFLVRFNLAAPTVLTGAAVYSQFSPVALGKTVVVKFRHDEVGLPAASNFAEIQSSIALIDNSGSASVPAAKHLYAGFAPLSFTAGTYWFGMSGSKPDNQIGLDFQFGRDIGTAVYQLAGNTLDIDQGTGLALPFRLYDGARLANPVPEPASWLMLLSGFACIGSALRHRHAVGRA